MLEKFADMALTYRGESIWVPDAKFGDYIGAGDGEITGDLLSGRVRWTLFENQAPDICDFSLVGTIIESGNTEHGFEILGYSEHEPETRTWRLSAGIRFVPGVANPAFPLVGVVTGAFHSDTQTHRYALFGNSGD